MSPSSAPQSPASPHQPAPTSYSLFASRKLNSTVWLTSINACLQAILLMAVGLTPLLFSQRTTELFEFPKMVFIYFLAVAALFLLAAKWLISQKITLVLSPLRWPLSLFLLWLIITALTSLHPYTSIAGYYTRFNGGLASYLAYGTLLYALLDQLFVVSQSSGKSKKDSNLLTPFLLRLLWTWLLSAIIVSIWAILEHFGHDPSCVILRGTFTANCWVEDVQARVFSTFGQPNWLATYLVATIPLGLSLVITTTKVPARLWASLGTIVAYTAFWYTYSRSGWFGLAAALGILALAIPWSIIWKHKHWLTGIILVCGIITISSFNTAALRVETSLSGHGADSSTGSIRLIVWQGALQIIAHHPLLGTGPGTFAYSFLPYRPSAMNDTTEWNFIYNEAHNQVLNTAATLGLPGLVIWLSLFIIPILYIWQGFTFNLSLLKNRGQKLKRSSKSETLNSHLLFRILNLSYYSYQTQTPHTIIIITLAAGIIGIFISQLLGFAVVVTNLLLFLSLAIIIAPFASINTIYLNKVRSSILALLVFLCLIPITYSLLNYTSAELMVKTADNVASYAPASAISHFQQAIKANPWETNYRLKLAGALVSAARLNLHPSKLLKQADDQLIKAEQLNRHDLIVIKTLSYYYRAMSQLEVGYQAKATQAAQTAVALSPTDAEAYQTLADWQLSLGNTTEALDSYNHLVLLRPHAPDSYLHRAEYYQQANQTNHMIQDLQTVLQLDPSNTQAKELLSGVK